MKEPDLTVNAENMRQWKSCCVYAWKRNSEWLYVGASQWGLSRPFGPHHVIDCSCDIEEGDTLEVWFFAEDDRDERNYSNFLNFEAQLISEHRPKYNVAGTGRPPKPSKKQLENMARQREIDERKGAQP